MQALFALLVFLELHVVGLHATVSVLFAPFLSPELKQLISSHYTSKYHFHSNKSVYSSLLGVTSRLIKVFLIFLQATNQCTEFQFLVLYADEATSCVDCESCPPGQGLSHECGTKISSTEMVHCMPCIQGSSFSTSYDTLSCIPCSASCSDDQLVNQTCSTKSDVKCAQQCNSKDRYCSCKLKK